MWLLHPRNLQRVPAAVHTTQTGDNKQTNKQNACQVRATLCWPRNYLFFQEFSNVWKQLARRFRGDPNILGYELLNEPWSGDIYADTSLLLPGQLPLPSSSPSALPPASYMSSAPYTVFMIIIVLMLDGWIFHPFLGKVDLMVRSSKNCKNLTFCQTVRPTRLTLNFPGGAGANLQTASYFLTVRQFNSIMIWRSDSLTIRQSDNQKLWQCGLDILTEYVSLAIWQ